MRPDQGAIATNQLQEQVERILSSEGLQNAEALRRLLQYLADKAECGPAECPKEYTVAVEGMGKPPTYDPQKSSSVRIQAGRLRQKLVEYYSDAGKDDPIVIELAKGSFHLTARLRNQAPEEETPVARHEVSLSPEHSTPPAFAIPRLFSLDFLIGVLVGCIVLATGWALTEALVKHAAGPAADERWTPELRALWAPFVQSKHPLIVSIEDPLFFELQSHPSILFRNRSLNDSADLQKSPELHTIAMRHANVPVQPSRYFTTFGEVEASLLLGQLLGPRVQILSLSRSSELTWNQLANNDVLFVGVQYSFFKQIKDLPIAPQLNPTDLGVADSHPAPGQPAFYADQYATSTNDQDVVYSLITHLPGPSNSTQVESFTSNRSPGYVAAVRWLTNSESAKTAVARLEDIGGGKIPPYYQVLLRVTSKDGVPIDVAYVLGRALH